MSSQDRKKIIALKKKYEKRIDKDYLCVEDKEVVETYLSAFVEDLLK